MHCKHCRQYTYIAEYETFICKFCGEFNYNSRELTESIALQKRLPPITADELIDIHFLLKDKLLKFKEESYKDPI